MNEIIFICEECRKVFTKEEKDKDCDKWGHPCKEHPRSKKEWRCESYLQEYKKVMP